ncbi:hypothetical protein [Dapis sp. BLCC M229]|uniref:hypothetical protein n=1 Tax=Dapis sp. BLCC M229 TaxID=3400188 RepID=UPI003CFB1E95
MQLTTQHIDILEKVQDFDTYMEKLIQDWNTPGVGIGIVAEDQLVFAKGHLLTYHGGYIDGFHSQVSFLPQSKIGVIVLGIGSHCTSLSDIITYNRLVAL